MIVALIDDQLLAAVMRGDTPPVLRDRELATTGHWYVRMCQAVLAATDRPGVLSGPLETMAPEQRTQAVTMLLELPPEIQLLSLRDLGPSIGLSVPRHSLNMLSIEVLAAANALDAEVFLSTISPGLEAALGTEGRECHVVELP